ncbi:Clr6 histone deacetylase associated PHD protein-2 Cph2 [Collariella sp. IMI 366227]|nr:Clr6 histone deacetylase associated PHD protein-2 Cph2 [Collariella sp. IMI 366227]
MAGLDASSPSLFADLDGGLDAFNYGDGSGSLGDSSLVEDLIDGGLGNSASATAAATVASSTAGENATPAPGQGPGRRSGTSSGSPSDVTASSHQQAQQPDFFNPATAPQWVFQATPPYDSPISSDNPFGIIPPAPQQQHSWELPLHLGLDSQLLQQQQHPSFYLQSSNLAAQDPNFVPVTTGANVPMSIAMPAHLQYHSPQSAAGSPDSASSGHDKGAVSSPDGIDLSKTNSRKRKSSAEVDEDDDDDDEQPVKKTAHNMIEKRYRTNLNDKIAALRDSVPSLRIMSKSARGEDTTEDREELHGLTPAHKLNKATVLSKATEYIRHLEKRNNRLIDENGSMQARIAAFEKLFMAGAITGQLPNPLQQPPTPMQYPQDAGFLNTPMTTPRGPDPPGMIPIPDDMKRILTAQQMNAGRPYPVPPQHFGQNPAMLRQQQIQQQQQQAQAQAGRWNPYFGKLMVGSLAGLMFMEAMVEKEPSNEAPEGRGLSIVPVHLFSDFIHMTHLTVGGYHITALDMITTLRMLILLGIFMWLACSSFIDMSGLKPSKKSKRTASVVKAVPSLASPIYVRRQAWLTAIQTVWVPRHNFFLEAAALLLKMLKYTLRNVVGSHGYLTLTGLSEEQEAARVKAWTIALDAQLAGGDIEINKSRLTLTLIASGTLPDTPLRLMLKALHIRVLLWRLNGASLPADMIAVKLARARWNEARQLNRLLNSLSEGEKTPDDVLPEHLAILLAQDCDEVLNDDIIQRAHNLAWNHQTSYNVGKKIDGMDAVVDDPAVRSPMDAVAAWYSNLTLHRILINSLRTSRNNLALIPGSDAGNGINLAVKVAPIGSSAQVRALIARAVLADGKRGAYIVTALQALGPAANPDKHPQYSKGVPPLIDSPLNTIVPDHDSHMALRCAMGIAQLQKFSDPPRAAFAVIESVLPEGADVEAMSLLGFTAAFHLMESLSRHPVGQDRCWITLERLAASMRGWCGSARAAGTKMDVDEAMRNQLVERCVQVQKVAVGNEVDPGYGSMEEEDVA